MAAPTKITLERASRLINSICDIAHGTSELVALGDAKKNAVLRRAIASHDNHHLYSWLMTTFNFQGISDKAASTYIAHHGNVQLDRIDAALHSSGLCAKLKGFWTFDGCGYRKTSRTCSCQSKLTSCPLPRLPLRNGRLNQTAFSLRFFIRDVADNDLVTFLDHLIDQIPTHASPREVHSIVVSPWRCIFGVSDKVVSMALATLLLSAPSSKTRWRTAGGALIAVDTLVHNLLHRTGLSELFGRTHFYGPQCYGERGCFDVLGELSKLVDARRFNVNFPSYFPRFVQLAGWKFAATNHENMCNAARIDDSKRCSLRDCSLRDMCGRVVIKQNRQNRRN